MLNQLLANSPLESGAITFILGLVITFLGITVIVIFVSLAGKLFNKTVKDEKPVRVKEVKVVEKAPEIKRDDVPEHVKVAIIAAISAYYYENQPKSNCDFIVKRIKRI